MNFGPLKAKKYDRGFCPLSKIITCICLVAAAMTVGLPFGVPTF